MKLNILKLYYGGRPLYSADVNPFSGAAIQDRALQTESGSSSSSKAGDGILSKESMNLLIKEGLPNDVNKFFLMLSAFESLADFGLGMNRSLLYSLRSFANRIIQNAKYLGKAEEEAVKNGAWDEIAVALRGYFYALDDKGKLQIVSFKSYDPTKYLALTYGELLERRKYAPDMIDNSDIATVVGNGVGMEKISEYILKIISTVGSNDFSSEDYSDLAALVGANAKKPNSQQLEAIKGLANQFDTLGADAIFKIKESGSDPHIREAMTYILSVLPNNMKIQLEGSYIAQGGKKEDAGSYAANLIVTALASGLSLKTAIDIDYDTALNKALDTTSGKRLNKANDPNPKTHNLTMTEVLFNNDLNREEVTITDPSYKNQYALKTTGTVIPGLVGDNNTPISNLPLFLALSGKGLGKYLDYSKAWMGNELISEGMLQNLVYLNDQVANVWMPVDYNGNIDWQGFSAFSSAENEIKEKNITNPALKNNIHAKYGSTARYDYSDKLIQSSGVNQFLMTHCYTIDDLINEKSNAFTKEITGEEEDYVDSIIRSIYTKEFKKKFGVDGIDSQLRWDDIYKVPVFIKVSPNAALNAATFAGYGSQVDNLTLEQDMLMLKQVPQLTAFGSELYNL